MPLTLLPWLLACHHADPVTFPSVLAPLEENRAAWPQGTPDDPYPETLDVVSGGDADLWWADARGYVDAPAGLVWQVSTEPDTVVDRREVDEWTVDLDTEPDFDVSMTIHCTVHDVITIDYDLTWVHELQEGTATAPERVMAQWDKTDGTPFIQLLEGTMVLEPDPDDPEVTRVELEEQLQASLRDDQTIASYLRDLHASLVARAHGDDLPVWE